MLAYLCLTSTQEAQWHKLVGSNSSKNKGNTQELTSHRHAPSCTHLEIFFKVVERYAHVASSLLQLNVRVTRQHKIKVKVVDGAAVQSEVVECERTALGRLNGETGGVISVAGEGRYTIHNVCRNESANS